MGVSDSRTRVIDGVTREIDSMTLVIDAMAKLGKERLGEKRSGEKRPGEKRSGEKRLGEERSGKKRSGEKRLGEERSGKKRLGKERPVRSGQGRSGQGRSGQVRSGQRGHKLRVIRFEGHRCDDSLDNFGLARGARSFGHGWGRWIMARSAYGTFFPAEEKARRGEPFRGKFGGEQFLTPYYQNTKWGYKTGQIC